MQAITKLRSMYDDAEEYPRDSPTATVNGKTEEFTSEPVTATVLFGDQNFSAKENTPIMHNRLMMYRLSACQC